MTVTRTTRPEQRSDADDTSAMWDAVRSIGTLRRAGHADDAVTTAEQALERWPGSDPVRSQLAWALYQRDLQPLDTDADGAARAQALAALQRIAELTAAAPYDTYSAFPHAVLRYATISRQQPARILPWLRRLDPAKLTTERHNDVPSHRSRWYSATTRALLDSGQPNHAIELCRTALDDGCLTESEARFIRYRIGKAQLAAGQPDAAYATLSALRGQLREWYLDASIATALADLGRTDDAIDACREALAARGGKLASRIHTLTLLTRLLHDRDHKLTPAHVQYVRQVRADERWPPERAVEQLAAELELPPIERRAGRPTRPPRELTSFWSATREHERERGTITTVFEHGKAGFLTTADGARLYFTVGQGATPTVGTTVSFRTVDSFDRKRQQPSKRAIELRTE